MAVHTLLVVWGAMNDPTFKRMSKQDQNIIKWACLLHDIRKRQSPLIEGKDHIHPFRSGVATLEVFQMLKMIDISEGSQKEVAFK